MLILLTERLRLRWFADEDAAWLQRLLNDADWLANIGDRGVRTEAAARSYVRDRLRAGCWQQGFGFWMVERRADGERLGMCGLTHREGLPEPDLGFAFLPEFRGQGYAIEAARGCLRYADEVLELDRVLAITAPHNSRSAMLLTKLGMVVDPTAPRRDAEGEVVRHVWQRAQRRGCVGGEAGAAGDPAAIDRLVARFYAAFDQRGPAPMTLPILPHLCVAQVTFRRLAGDDCVVADLRTFVSERLDLFASELEQFHEVEESSRTEVHGAMAQRWSVFRSRGRRRGEPFTVEGRKSMQFVRDRRGWRIASVLYSVEPTVQ